MSRPCHFPASADLADSIGGETSMVNATVSSLAGAIAAAFGRHARTPMQRPGHGSEERWVLLLALVLNIPAAAQTPVRLRETFPIDYQDHVSCRVNLTGQLTVPADSDKEKPTTVEVR